MSDMGSPPKVGTNVLIQTALNTIAMVAFALLALTSLEWAGFALAAVTLVWIGALFVIRKPGGFTAIQVLVLLGVLVCYDRRPGISALDDRLLLATGLMQMGMLLNQNMFKKITVRKKILVEHLPGANFPTAPLVRLELLIVADLVLLALLGVSAALNAPGWPVAAATTLVLVTHAALVLQAGLRRRREHGANAVIRHALERLQPEFAFHFSAPAASLYHIEMWLPYLEALGRPYFVIMREAHSFDQVAKLTKRPVVFCSTTAALDNACVPTLKTVFYANNGMKNAHMVRFSQLTHVQLLHGDSDKAPSFSPVTNMFDRVYVAGQAGIDRYAANNVYIDPEKFVIVGRPQVGAIEVGTHPIGTVADKTVLYAPTWSGYTKDAAHTSLPIGAKIVGELLSRGIRVIYRPHPYTSRYQHTKEWDAGINAMLAEDQQRTGRTHVFGAAATTDMPLFACFNACDAAIADISGVSSDFLYSEKPLAVTDAMGEGDDFVTANPICRATYVIRQDGSNIAEVVDAMTGGDPMETTRRQMKRYVLGDFPAATYTGAFRDAALFDIGATTEFVKRGAAEFVVEATADIAGVPNTVAGEVIPAGDGDLLTRP
jgi:hypothetical protein